MPKGGQLRSRPQENLLNFVYIMKEDTFHVFKKFGDMHKGGQWSSRL
jgi:hypothetical protein